MHYVFIKIIYTYKAELYINKKLKFEDYYPLMKVVHLHIFLKERKI